MGHAMADDPARHHDQLRLRGIGPTPNPADIGRLTRSSPSSPPC